MRKATGICVLLLLWGATAAAQDAGKASQAQSSDGKEKISYLPKIDGAVKAKVEFDINGGAYRFNVRNSRFGVRGNVSRNMTYRIQVDFSNEGKLSILDSYVGYQIGGLLMTLGQQQYHFSTDLDRGPSTNMFANRSFLAKYLTSYFGSEVSGSQIKDYVRTLGSRDLGLLFRYDFRLGVPFRAYAGLFNGSGSNNPEWNNHVNVIGRIEAGGPEGVRGSVAYYDGYAPLHLRVREEAGEMKTEKFDQRMRMVGFELRYVRGNFFAEGEYARRYLGLGRASEVMTVAQVHTYYKIGLPEKAFANHIAPIVRWDMGNNVDYLNTGTDRRQAFSANRITAGINIGFGEKLIRSEVRLNYEKYLLKKRPSDFADNRLLHDKFTIEVIAAF